MREGDSPLEGLKGNFQDALPIETVSRRVFNLRLHPLLLKIASYDWNFIRYLQFEKLIWKHQFENHQGANTYFTDYS